MFYFFIFEAYEQGKKKGGLKIVGFFRKMPSAVKKVTFSGRIWFVVRVFVRACVCLCTHALCPSMHATHMSFIL